MQHFYRVVAHDAVFQRPFMSGRQTRAAPVNAPQCRGNPAPGARFRHRHETRPHAKTNLQRHRRFATKQRGEIYRRC